MKKSFYTFFLMAMAVMLALPTATMAAGDESPQTIEVKVQQPWGWQNATSVAFGNVCIGFASSKDLQVNVSDMSLDVTAETDNPAFSATLTKGESNWTMTVSVLASEEGALSGQLTVKSGDASVELSLSATAQDLSASTLQDLKAKATAYNTTYYYTGRAVVSHVEGTYIFVEDETASAVIAPGNSNVDLKPGDVVTFNAQANSPNTEWMSFNKGNFQLVATNNWQAPYLTKKTSLTSDDYGRMVNLTKVKYEGVEATNYHLFKNDEGETFTVHAATSGNPFFEELTVDADTYYDVIGAVYSYNRNYAAPYPHVTPIAIRPSEPAAVLNDLYEVVGTQVDGMENAQKCSVTADANDNYKYWFDGLFNDASGQSVKVFGVMSADGTTVSIPTGQQLFNTSTTTDDAFLAAYENYSDGTAAPLRKGTEVVATIAADGTITLPMSLVAAHHDGEADTWNVTGGWFENAVLTPVVYTHSLDIKVQKPWGWVNGSSLEFGTTCIGKTATLSARVYSTDMEADITAESDDPAFTVTLTKGEEYWDLTVTALNDEEGSKSATLTISSEGAESKTLALTATFADLTASTLRDFKAKATEYNVRYYFTGEAIVSRVEGLYVFVEDETDAAVITMPMNYTDDLMAGDVIRFSANANSPSYEWKSFMQPQIEHVKYFNWKEPICTPVESLSAADYGKLVRIKNVKYDHQDVTAYYGIVTYYTYFKNDAGEEFVLREVSDTNRYYGYKDYDANIYYDIIGAVYSYNQTQTHTTPHVTPVNIRPSVPAAVLNDLYEVAGTQIDGTENALKCNVAADANDNYKYWFDGLFNDASGQSVKVFGVMSADGTTVSIPTGQQLFNTSTTTDDAFLAAYESYSDGTAAPLRKGTEVIATIAADGTITLPKSLVAAHHDSEADSWSTTGGWHENAVLTPVVYTHSLDIKVQKPWGWANGSSLEFGTICIGQPATLSARVYSTDMEADVIAESDDPAFTATLTKGEEYWDLTVTALSNDEGSKAATLTISSEGAESKTLTLTATFADLAASTLQDLKAKATEYNVRYYYTGEATVSRVEGLYVFVEDETDAAVITMPMNYTDDLMAGDVIRFSANANSPTYEWKSFMQPQIEHVKYFNWKEPICTPVESLTAADYGKLVRIKNVKYDRQDVTSYYGTVTYYTYFKNDAGEEFVLREVSDTNRYYGYKDYDANIYYDIIGAVYSYNQMQAPPTPHVTPVNIRPSVPVRTLETGEYQGSGYYIIWGKNNVYKYMCTITQDEEDPYKYWFDNIITDYNGYTPKVYGILSNDGNSIDLPTGQQLYNTSTSTDDIFFSAYDEFPDAQKVAPWRKGTIATATIDENGVITFPMSIVIAHYNESFEGTEYDNLTWGYWGGFYAGLTLKKYKPIPVVTDWNVEANGVSAVLTWSAPENDNGYEILGYAINRDGELIAECDSETFTFTDSNLKEGTYSYSIVIVTNEGESDPSDVKQVTITIPTGIDEITHSQLAGTTVYDLNGYRVEGRLSTLKKGVYVVNGRKVVVK